MLTLKEINEISFRKSKFSGYKPEDVDDFIDEVTKTVTQLQNDNAESNAKLVALANQNKELSNKLRMIAEKIEKYREDEDNIKRALLSAQKLGTISIKEAKAEAEEIVSTANKKADEMIEEAKKTASSYLENHDARMAEKEREFDEIKQKVTVFKSSLFEMYKNHLSEIEEIPDFSDELNRKKEFSKSMQSNEEAVTEVEPQVVVPEVETIQEEKEPAEKFEYTPSEETIVIPEIEDFNADDTYDEYAFARDNEPKTAPEQDMFNTIDFNEYTNIPEALKKEKSQMYDTLEFGDGIKISK